MKRHQKRSRSMLAWKLLEIAILCTITVTLLTVMINSVLSSPASPSVENIYITDTDNVTADDLLAQTEYRFWVEIEDADTLSDIENVMLVIYLDNENLTDNMINHYTLQWTRDDGFEEVGPGGYAEARSITVDANIGWGTYGWADTRLPLQHKVFYIDGRFWLFYHDDSDDNVYWRTSLEGTNWSARNYIGIKAWTGAYFTVWWDGENFEAVARRPGYAYANYRSGTPLDNGDINWVAAWNYIEDSTWITDPTIILDTNGYPWIGAKIGLNSYPTILKSSVKDGSSWWTENAWILENSALLPTLVPLLNGQVFVVYSISTNTETGDNQVYGKLWNGTSWSEKETASTSNVNTTFFAMFGAASTGLDNDVYVVFLSNEDNNIIFVKRTWGVGWGNEENVRINATDKSTPTLTLDNLGNTWVFWQESDNIYYRKRTTGGTWGSITNWFTENENLSGYGVIGTGRELYDNKLLIYYTTCLSAPYAVKFAYRDLSVSTHLVIDNCAAGNNDITADNFIFAIKFGANATVTANDNWDMFITVFDNASNHDNEFFLNQFDVGSAPNVHPDSPTILFCEGQTNPTQVIDFTPEFSAVFNDNDTGDTAENMEIWVGTSSDDNDMWASGWIDISAVENNARSEDVSYGGNALSSGVIYYWRCRFMDENGSTGIWSIEVATFRINRSPNSPILLLCEGQSNPIYVTDLSPEFSAIGTDNDGDQMNHYALQVDDDSGFGSPIWNRTKTSITIFDNGARCEDITYDGNTLSRGTIYYWHIKFWDDGGDEEYWSTETATFKLNRLPTVPENWTDLGTDVTDFTPTIEWSKGTDGDGDTVTTYVYVGTNSTPTGYETSTVDNTCELGNTITLSEDGVYFYRLRSWDGLEWSDYTTTDQFQMTGEFEPPYPSVPDITVENNGERLLMIHPIADAPVSQLFPDQNYGHQSLSYVQYNPNEPITVWTYVKYRVPENILRQDKFEIYDIRLSLTVHGSHVTPEIHIYETSSDWSEDTITWNNKPDLGRFVVNTSASWDESFDNYDRIFASLNDYTFTAGEVSFVIVPNENIPADKTYYLTFMMREAGQFGTIEFAYMRVHIIPASLVSIALLCTLAFAGFGVYKKMGEIHDMDSLIEGWTFLLYLSILIMTAVVLAWSFIG